MTPEQISIATARQMKVEAEAAIANSLNYRADISLEIL